LRDEFEEFIGKVSHIKSLELIDSSLRSLPLLNYASIKPWLSANNLFATDDNVSLAAWTGNIEAMERHVLQGEDISLADKDGWTALHMAVWNMHVDMIELLLQIVRRFSVSAQTADHESALHFAMFNDDSHTVRNLLDAGADPTSKDGHGMTPISVGALFGSIYAIKVLKEGGVDVSVRSHSGASPMHLAAYNGHVDVIKVLKEAGADVSAQDDNGNTPMHFAMQNKHMNAIKALKEAGAGG
jgi:ankyrin repeat protein